MEKLRCTSCGGELIVDEDKQFGTCNYCGTKYKLNKDLNINIKLDDNTKNVLNDGLSTVTKTSKLFVIPIVIIFIVASTIIGIVMFKVFSSINNNFNSKQRDYYVDEFNFPFTYDSGTNSAFFVKKTLDDIIKSNKTNDRKISLVYEGNETTSESEIINIKHSLSGEYEVSIDYDSEGYINKITLEKIKRD